MAIIRWLEYIKRQDFPGEALMSALSSWIRRWPFWSFYLLALVFPCMVITTFRLLALQDPSVLLWRQQYFAFLHEHHAPGNWWNIARFALTTHHTYVLFNFLFPAGPSIAALIISRVGWGSEGTRKLLSRFKPWGDEVRRGEAVTTYAVLVGAYLLILGGFLWVSYTQGALQAPYLTLGGTPLLVLGTALLGLFLDDGATFEELGWRGYALPVLQERLPSPLIAAILLGVLWWAWHLPREVITILGGVNLWSWGVGQLVFCAYVVALSILITYAVNRTGGSVWPAIFIHAGTNVWNKSGATAASDQLIPIPDMGVREALIITLAIIFAIIAGTQLGRQRTSAARA
jgi:hypothetical protein